jgi:hypothetical protein
MTQSVTNGGDYGSFAEEITWLDGFVLCQDLEHDGTFYAYRPLTGETLYGATEEGDCTGLDRSFSCWRQANEEQPNQLNGIACYSYDANAAIWGRSRPMTEADAMSLYEKHYDHNTGFFFFVDRTTGETLWNKPPGVPANLPCASSLLVGGYSDSRDNRADVYDGYGDTIEQGQSQEFPAVTDVQDKAALKISQSSSDTSQPPEVYLPDIRGRGGRFDSESGSFKKHHGRIVPYPWQQTIDYRKDENGTQELMTAQKPLSGTFNFTYPYPLVSRQLIGARGTKTVPWKSFRRTQPAPQFKFLDAGNVLEGPYCRRSGTGKQMVKAINRLPVYTSSRDRVAFSKTRGGDLKEDRLFEYPEDINYDDWELGHNITLLDGKVERESNFEAMILGRGGFEGGGAELARTMARYQNRPDVQMFGLINLAKYDYHETEEGYANPDGVAAMNWTLTVMPMYLENEAIQCRAVAVLAQLADNYAMRRELVKEDWTGKAVAAMNGNRMMTREMVLDHGHGRRERIEIKEPSRFAKDTCAWTCKLFGLMACDNAHRSNVADDGMSVVMHAMRFCPDDPIVQLNACKALYNFVYRCEAAHTLATEEDIIDLVEPLLEKFPSDKELIRITERALRALSPDGWRGGADDPNENGQNRNFDLKGNS